MDTLETRLSARPRNISADEWAVRANHFCSRGAVVDKTKNGKPTDSVSRPSSQGMGLASLGGTAPRAILIGHR